MKYITPKITAQIDVLVNIAKRDPRSDVRVKATHALWELCGDFIVHVTTKNSIKVDSDYSYHGMSFSERSCELMGQCYRWFLKWLKDYDPSRGVPFLAFVCSKSEFQMKDEQRKNARRSKWVSMEGADGCFSDSASFANCDKKPFTYEINSFESDVEKEDLLRVLRKECGDSPRMLEVFNAMNEVKDECNKHSDAAMAEKLGCTRANALLLRKKTAAFLRKKGLEDDCRLIYE